MSNKREALEAALSALESERIMAADSAGNYTIEITPKRITEAIAKVKAALAEPEQEPVAWLVGDSLWERKPAEDDFRFWEDLGEDAPTIKPLYTSPSEWQELSEIEVSEAMLKGMKLWLANDGTKPVREFQGAEISAALRAKNGG